MNEEDNIPVGSPAHKDIVLWAEYEKWCDKANVLPKLDGYLLWLDEYSPQETVDGKELQGSEL